MECDTDLVMYYSLYIFSGYVVKTTIIGQKSFTIAILALSVILVTCRLNGKSHSNPFDKPDFNLKRMMFTLF